MPTSLALQLTDRLVRYCAIATPSDESATATPSTPGQLALGRLLHDELVALGAADVVHAENGFVYATIPATVTDHAVPVVAFLAHLDTVFVTEPTVKPRVHLAYDGSPLTFPDDELLVLLPEINPYLATKIGDTLITASLYWAPMTKRASPSS
jgi:tripeptide aminopeptidase